MTEAARPLAGTAPLIDAHAHFYHAASGRGDWQRVNAARLRAGDAIGVTYHVASILGKLGVANRREAAAAARLGLR